MQILLRKGRNESAVQGYLFYKNLSGLWTNAIDKGIILRELKQENKIHRRGDSEAAFN